MTVSKYFGIPPYNGVDVNDWILRATNVINGSLNGKTNNTGNVTLNTSTSTTTVILAKGRLGPNTIILFEPTTANAAVEISTGTMWVSTRDPTNNMFMITNAVNNKNDRTFNFILVG